MTANIGYTDSNIVSVTATVVSRGTCWFTTPTANLNFGNLDSSNPVDVNANTSFFFAASDYWVRLLFYQR
jgi:hypothetical protein